MTDRSRLEACGSTGVVCRHALLTHCRARLAGGGVDTRAGWLTICGSFTLSPIVAHGVVGEWGRGLLFAGVPAAMTGGTVALFQIEPGTVNHGTLGQQRIMWGFFGAAFLASAAGIVDATLAAKRARPLTIAPVVGTGRVGVEIGGAL